MVQLGHPTCREKAPKPPPLPGSQPPHPHLPSASIFPGNTPQFLLLRVCRDPPLSFIHVFAPSKSLCENPPGAIRHPALDAKRVPDKMFQLYQLNEVNQVKNFLLLMRSNETSPAGGGGQSPAPPYPPCPDSPILRAPKRCFVILQPSVASAAHRAFHK